MFTVGEFSLLAQVSKRLLRYYDEIGLLKPVQTDPQTGYRYYSAEQMSDLNRILALKDLGLSLDQIQRILRDNVTTEEIQGMLLLKKAEIEQQLRGELQRIRSIESRLQSIRSAEAKQPLNVVLKEIPAQPVLSVRTTVDDFEAALGVFERIQRALPEKGRLPEKGGGYGLYFCMCHSGEYVERDMDMEFGRMIEGGAHSPVALSGGALRLTYRELPAVPVMATTVVTGALQTIHGGYREIGMWVEANAYCLAGIPREITLRYPRLADGSDLITEIQFPVEAR